MRRPPVCRRHLSPSLGTLCRIAGWVGARRFSLRSARLTAHRRSALQRRGAERVEGVERGVRAIALLALATNERMQKATDMASGATDVILSSRQ